MPTDGHARSRSAARIFHRNQAADANNAAIAALDEQAQRRLQAYLEAFQTFPSQQSQPHPTPRADDAAPPHGDGRADLPAGHRDGKAGGDAAFEIIDDGGDSIGAVRVYVDTTRKELLAAISKLQIGVASLVSSVSNTYDKMGKHMESRLASVEARQNQHDARFPQLEKHTRDLQQHLGVFQKEQPVVVSSTDTSFNRQPDTSAIIARTTEPVGKHTLIQVLQPWLGRVSMEPSLHQLECEPVDKRCIFRVKGQGALAAKRVSQAMGAFRLPDGSRQCFNAKTITAAQEEQEQELVSLGAALDPDPLVEANSGGFIPKESATVPSARSGALSRNL